MVKRRTGIRIGITLAVSLLLVLLAGVPVYQVVAAPPGQSPEDGKPGLAQPVQPGDTARGKNLFTGVTRFQNSGPPCLACHSTGGIGALGGGQLGPDLTGAFGKFGGEAGLVAILETFPFPTMNPVWRDNPLTPQERVDVAAFLESAAVAERPAESVGWLVAIGVGGAAALFLVSHLWWRRRLRKVREPMVTRQAARSSQSSGGR